MKIAQQAAQKLFSDAIDGLKWYVQSIPKSDDFREMYNAFGPLRDLLAKQDDPVHFEAAAHYIEDHFNGLGKKLVRTLKEDIKKMRLQQNQDADSASDLPIYPKDGVYYKKLANGAQRISNFLIDIKDRVLQDDILFYRCDLTSVQGDIAEQIMFSPAERCDVRKFRVLVAGVGDFHFNGRDHELSGVWQYEQNSNKDARMILLVQRYGWIDERKMWLFSNCAITNKVHPIDQETDYIKVDHYNIRSSEVQVYQNTHPHIDFKTAYSKDLCAKISDMFITMLDSTAAGSIKTYTGLLFLGFIPATIYSNEIFEKYGLFPFLFPYGPSGTGKSTATELLMSFFGFTSGTRENFDDASVPGIAQAVGQLSSVPYWLDEFKDGYKFDQLKQTIKNIYNRVGTGKGGLVKRLVREVRSTLWLSGQYLPDDEAVISRSVILRFNPTNKYKNRAYKWLTENKSTLSAVTLQVLLRKSDDLVKNVIEQIDTYQSFLTSNDELAPRYAINYSIVAACLQLLDIDIPDDFDAFLLEHAKQTLNYAQEENEALVFFKEINNAWTRAIIPKQHLYIDMSSGELRMRFDPVIALIQADMRKRTNDLKLAKSSMIKDYLKDVPGYIFDNSKNGVRRSFPVGERREQRNCVVFSLRELPDKFQQAISDLIDDFAIKKDEVKL